MSLEYNTLLTLLSAVVWAMVGYLAKQEDEAFSPGKLFFTFVAAVVVACLAVGWQVPEEMGYQFCLYILERSGLVGVVYKALRAAYKWSGLKKWWESLEVG